MNARNGVQTAPVNPVSSKSTGVGVAIITHNAVSLLGRCLEPLIESPLRPRILVVNSSSNDGTIELARSRAVEVLVIPRREFNHGYTREVARHALGTEIVVMLTPDALACGPETISRLVRPVECGEASVSYARQIPHHGAGLFEAFPRAFNYPAHPEIRHFQDVRRLGPATFFCSNACAAWSNAALDEIGGFSPTLSLEDVIATARLLRAGHRIAYCADAVVFHSHCYTLIQEFRRDFDIGYVRAQHRKMLFSHGTDESRGAAYSASLIIQVIRHQPWLFPYAIAHLAARYSGYRIGFHASRLPLRLRRWMSAQDYYWQDNIASRELALGPAQTGAAT